jgi:hypothetical protein
MLPEAVINYEILPYLRPTERADLQSMILPPDQRVRSPLYALDTLSNEQFSALEEMLEAKRVMAAVDLGPWHTAQCARIRANLYNPARFVCGVRQLYEMLVTKDILGNGVPRYMSLLTMDLMLRQDAELEIDTGKPLPRNRLAYKLAWTAAGRLSNVSTPASSRRSSMSSVHVHEVVQWDEDEGEFLVQRFQENRDIQFAAMHARNRLRARRRARREVEAEMNSESSESDELVAPPAPRRLRRGEAGVVYQM